MRSTVVTPSPTTRPGGRLARAISTPSSGCRRMSAVMVVTSNKQSGETGANSTRRTANSKVVARLPLATSHSLLAFSSLAARILAGLIDLKPRIGRHQADLVRQRHELETHVDGAHRALGAAAVNAGVEL